MTQPVRINGMHGRLATRPQLQSLWGSQRQCQPFTAARRAAGSHRSRWCKPVAAAGPRQMLVYVPPHPLVAHWLAILRSRDTPSPMFRSAMAELGRILIYEAARDWLPTFETQVETPLATADAVVIDPRRPVKVVPILRAGLVPLEHASTVLPAMQTYHVGLIRDEKTLQPIEYLNKLPKTLDKEDRVLVSDPMVATGGSMVKVLDDLVARGADPALIRVISITVAPAALKLLSEKFPGMKVYTACIDPELNDKGYIVPGLGDAGDRAFGTASSDQFGNLTE